MRASLLVVVLAGLVATIAGCQRNDNTSVPAPSGSIVKIVTITPDISSPLRTGDRVKLKVDISYNLTVDSGTIALVVQDSNNSGIAQTMEVLTKGNGKTSLEVEFTVPNTKAVQVFAPLSAQGQASTSTVEYRAYKVVTN